MTGVNIQTPNDRYTLTVYKEKGEVIAIEICSTSHGRVSFSTPDDMKNVAAALLALNL